MNDLVTINRPIKDVFEFVANHANDKLWKPFVTTSKQTSAGHIGVGTRFEVGMVTWNHYLASIVEIVEYEPYRWYVYKVARHHFILSLTCHLLRWRLGLNFVVMSSFNRVVFGNYSSL